LKKEETTVSAFKEAIQRSQPTPPPIIRKTEEIKAPVKLEFTVREFPKEPSKIISPEEYKPPTPKLPSERLKPKDKIPHKQIEIPIEPTKPEITVKEFPKEPSRLITQEEIKPKIVEKPIEPPKPKENICPFCGLKNKLEAVSCQRCAFKLKK